jgi:hypothetical protein
VRFALQPKEGVAWSDVLLPKQEPGGEWDLPVERFESLGIDPIRTYRGRFLGNGRAGEIASDAFLFRPCGEWLSAEIEYVPPNKAPFLVLRSETSEPIARAWARIGTGERSSEVDLAPAGDGVFATFAAATCDPPQYSVHAVTTSGRVLPDAGMQASCFRTRQNWPTPSSCASHLTLEQEFPYCKGSPDQLHLEVEGNAPVGSRLDFELVGRAGPPLASVVTTQASFGTTVVLDVTGEPEGGLPVRAWVTPPEPKPDDPPVEASVTAVIDRTRPWPRCSCPRRTASPVSSPPAAPRRSEYEPWPGTCRRSWRSRAPRSARPAGHGRRCDASARAWRVPSRP